MTNSQNEDGKRPDPKYTRFVKLWPARRHTEAYQKLTLSQRGLLMELELLCKDQTDNGMVLLTNYGHLNTCVGGPSAGVTCRLLQCLIQGKWVSVIRNEPKILLLKIAMYVTEQQRTTDKHKKTRVRKDHTIPDHNRTDHTTPTSQIAGAPKGRDLLKSPPENEESGQESAQTENP